MSRKFMIPRMISIGSVKKLAQESIARAAQNSGGNKGHVTGPAPRSSDIKNVETQDKWISLIHSVAAGWPGLI